MIFDLDEAARGADGIDVALRKNGAEPGFERAATVKIAKERTIFGFARRVCGDAVKIGEQRIGKVLRGDRISLAVKNRSGSGAQVSAIGDDEKFPSGGLAAGACCSEAEVLQMKRAEKFFELGARNLLPTAARGETFRGAAFERVFETLARNRPRGSGNFGIEAIDEIGMRYEQTRRFGGAVRGAVHASRIAT